MAQVWFIILLLILVNALYVAAEFATVSVRRSRIQQSAEEGNRLARLLLPVLEDGHRLDRYIAACQIGITISSLVLGAYGQARLAPALAPSFAALGGMQEAAAQSSAAVVVLIGLTVLQMVLGELVPKSLALQYPTRLALVTVIPMRWSLRALSWFIAILNGSGIALLRLLGLEAAGHRHIHSPQEIEYLIAESRQGGLLAPTEHRRLRRALRLTARRVSALMVPRTRIQAVAETTQFAELVKICRESPYTRLPVYQGTIDHVVGILHVQDVAARWVAGSADASARDLLRPFIVLHESMRAEQALARLREEKQHIAIVIDEFGGTAGLLTIADILDEIFGSMADEFKPGELRPERLPDGRVRVPGAMRVDEVEAWIGARWQGEAHTVSGLVLERLGEIPEAGTRLLIDGLAVEVERISGRRLESILVTPHAEARPWST